MVNYCLPMHASAAAFSTLPPPLPAHPVHAEALHSVHSAKYELQAKRKINVILRNTNHDSNC